MNRPQPMLFPPPSLKVFGASYFGDLIYIHIAVRRSTPPINYMEFHGLSISLHLQVPPFSEGT